MGEMAYETKGITHQFLAEFDEQLARLEQGLDQFTAVLHPILEAEGPDVAGMSPEEAPVHDLHNSILRLRRYNNRLDRIRPRVRL